MKGIKVAMTVNLSSWSSSAQVPAMSPVQGPSITKIWSQYQVSVYTYQICNLIRGSGLVHPSSSEQFYTFSVKGTDKFNNPVLINWWIVCTYLFSPIWQNVFDVLQDISQEYANNFYVYAYHCFNVRGSGGKYLASKTRLLAICPIQIAQRSKIIKKSISDKCLYVWGLKFDTKVRNRNSNVIKIKRISKTKKYIMMALWPMMLSRLIHFVRNGELDRQPLIFLQNKALNLFHLQLLPRARDNTRNYFTEVVSLLLV